MLPLFLKVDLVGFAYSVTHLFCVLLDKTYGLLVVSWDSLRCTLFFAQSVISKIIQNILPYFVSLISSSSIKPPTRIEYFFKNLRFRDHHNETSNFQGHGFCLHFFNLFSNL